MRAGNVREINRDKEKGNGTEDWKEGNVKKNKGTESEGKLRQGKKKKKQSDFQDRKELT